MEDSAWYLIGRANCARFAHSARAGVGTCIRRAQHMLGSHRVVARERQDNGASLPGWR